ncbi:rust resistance kinase Lr10-like isoform X1 [Nicotiana tabacum]|uniref:Rust resistance kinase Lr10-like n=1 Tax=Nicotiana tabacum TaxID=4097 RepID=A0A1S4ACJ5_TOBAC|nr:PREDICTED: rust resistance kinase Lr10-like [Nicotiana tabacum]
MTFTSFVCFILICYLVQTKGRSDSSCPKSFSCGNLTDLSFPFTLSTQSDCGFLSISGCDAKPFPRIQLLPGGDWYYALGKPYNYTVWLRDTKLEATLRQHECQVFDENFSLTNSPYISFNILNLHNFFKCNKSSNNTLNVTLKRKDHFTGYEMYDGCDAFSIYYKLHGDDDDDDDDRDISAGNLTAACSLVRLPIVSVSNNGNVFTMLSPEFQVEWKLSDECYGCHYSGGQCQTDITNKFLCHTDVSNKTAAGTSKRGHLRTPWFIVATGTFFSCIGLLVLLFYFREKILWYKYLRFWDSNAEDHRNIEAFLMNYGLYAPKRYSYSEVKRITSHFKNKLGQGGCGNVYKGRLHNGKHVAVKLANRKGTSGEEFINEVASISKTSHVNIVSLVGFCFEGRRRALIYEFMPNGSLEKFIYEERSNRVRQLSWPILYKIARGIARGLEYLHRGCTTRILHFDIKPHNILLDDDFCPKISDFGLAKLCMKKESVVSMLGARGTIGYIAPEIVCRNLGGVSHKSDVYSYGMMVLEMVGGRKNVDVEVDRTSEIYFPHWLYRRIELDEELQLIGIMNDSEKECARKMVLVSLWCIQTDPSNRPSMSKVVEMLEGNQDYSLQIPPKPYLYPASRSEVKSSVVVEPAQALFVDMSANILYEI